jgi:cyclic pyranopterin phosphate synthase
LTLRVSVLDRCQYRCPYCRPGSLAPFTPRERRLTPGDYARLAPVFAERRVTKVRFTGGEPLLRPDLPEVAAALRDGITGCQLAVTTNGQLLGLTVERLARAGVSRATVHVDSLRPERYRALMGDGDARAVVRALLDARSVLAEVKVNVVVQRGKNDDEIGDFLDFSRDTGVEVRFIELMNTGSAVAYTRQVFFSGREILDAVRARSNVHAIPRRHPSDPSALWITDEGVVFGVIASDTEPFCDACNRLRLSAEGRLTGCLYQGLGVDLAAALRRDDGDASVRALVDAAVSGKRSFHPERGGGRRHLPFSMAQTGG